MITFLKYSIFAFILVVELFNQTYVYPCSLVIYIGFSKMPFQDIEI